MAHRAFSSLFNTGSIQEFATKLSQGNFNKIGVMTGAGISVNAGIPDFRSPETGLYKMTEGMGLPFPEAVFDINYFKRDPKPFFALGPKLKPEHIKPTPTHYFIRLLELKKKLLICFTQNIDALEKKTGLSEEKLVETHGTNETAHCTECGSEFDTIEMTKCLRAGKPAYCECGGVAKPDVVFFGEKIPWKFHANCDLMGFADLLLVIGTSLEVFPFASLVDEVSDGIPRVVISKGNNEGYLHSGFVFNSEKEKKRDVLFEGDCDEIIKEICEIAGWSKELEELMRLN